MSKFYIVSEEEIYSMRGYADQREWDEPEIFRKEVLNPAYEVEFDGDLREFVREKIKRHSYEQEICRDEPNYNFHDWRAERELKALNHAWECEIQDIYERFLDSHRYTAGTANEIIHKEYLDEVERTLNRELEAVNKAYEEKRKAVKAKLSENMSENDEKEEEK